MERRHHTMLGVLCALVCALVPSTALAAGSDNAAGAPFLHFSKVDRMDLSSYTTENGEILSDQGPFFCDPTLSAWVIQTGWYWVEGNGRQLSVEARGPVGPLVGVYSGNPLSGSLSALVDCRFAPGVSTVTWPSVPGHRYLVQVGICRLNRNGSPDNCNPSPAAPVTDVVSRSAPPSYDSRGAAAPLDPNAHYDNHGATRDPAETNSCGSINYGNTVWLQWTAPTWGIGVFRLEGMAGVVSIRRASGDAVAGCGAGAAEAPVAKGETLFLQVGGDVLGTDVYSEGHFKVTPSIRDPDDDNDGAPNAVDCRPLDPAIRPGKPEIRDDDVDQNCVARDDKSRKPSTTSAFTVSAGRLKTFALNEVLKRSRVVVSCKGTSCRKRKVVVAKRLKRNVKRLNLPRKFVGPLRRGTRIRIQVTNTSKWMGRRFEWRMTSSSSWNFKGYCEVKKRWRRC